MQHRIVQWSLQHPREWEIVCGIGAAPDTAEFQRIARMLLGENLFDAYYVLFTRMAHRHGIPPVGRPEQQADPDGPQPGT